MNQPSRDLSATARTVTGADLLARRLAAAGIRTAFGIPGGEVLALVDALERAGIRFVLARHENAAGFMAEAQWHATGAPGLLVATLGPGIANAVNVIANALQDRVPLIAIAGSIAEGEAETYTHQVMDHRALFASVTKATFRAASGTEDLVADKAIAKALRGRPGPVYIDLPVAVAEAVAAERPVVVNPVPAPGIPADLERARTLVAAARRPLVLAGLDLISPAGAAALDRFLTATAAPLLTTYKAKGLVPEGDPRVVGAVGLSPIADRIVRPLLDAADLIVLAGYDPIEMRAGWRDPFGAVPVIDIVAEALPHGMHRADVVIEGDVAGILDRLTPAAPVAAWPGGEPAAVRGELRAAFRPKGDWGPGVVFETLRAVAPADVVATADSGAHRILLSQAWSCPAPRSLIQSTGFCTMGCAVPLAAGLAFASGRTTLAFVGDAGLEMGLGELATLRDLALSVVVVVLADDSLSLIEMKQRRSGLANAGVDFGRSDLAMAARALGGHGVEVADRETLDREARAAFARPGFTVIVARIDRRAYDGAF